MLINQCEVPKVKKKSYKTLYTLYKNYQKQDEIMTETSPQFKESTIYTRNQFVREKNKSLKENT